MSSSFHSSLILPSDASSSVLQVTRDYTSQHTVHDPPFSNAAAKSIGELNISLDHLNLQEGQPCLPVHHVNIDRQLFVTNSTDLLRSNSRRRCLTSENSTIDKHKRHFSSFSMFSSTVLSGQLESIIESEGN